MRIEHPVARDDSWACLRLTESDEDGFVAWADLEGNVAMTYEG